jgi:C4-dicarboxylate-specific signal transduction histidine kinase
MCVAAVYLLWQRIGRKHLEFRPSTAMRRLLIASRAARLGVLELDSMGRPVWVNAQFPLLTGLGAFDPPTLQRVMERLHQDDRDAFRWSFEHAQRSREPVTAEVRLAMSAGEPRWIETIFAGSVDRAHRTGTVVVIAKDFTEHKRLEAEHRRQRQQLRRLARVSLLGELSEAIVHELNQPLSAILSNAEAGQRFLDEDNRNLGEVREIFKDIVSDDTRAGDVIRRLRALLARGEAHLQRVEVPQLVKEVAALQRAELASRGVRLSIQVPESLPAVRADPIELQQVLLNLILNASEAMNGGAQYERLIEICAAVMESGLEVRLSVLDRGRGIDPERLDQVFDPFFTTKPGGLGLGLSVCRTIVLAYGGNIWAGRRARGGAAFHFTIPVFQEECHAYELAQGVRH